MAIKTKQAFSKISEHLPIEKLKNDKRVVVFLVCLLIATTLWFLNALSKEYSTTLSYPVKFIEPPQEQFLVNQLPSTLELNVDAHGFTLLRHKLSLSLSPIILNIQSIIRNSDKTVNGFRILSNKLTRQISNQISNEITIKNIQPDIFYIKLDSLTTKLIPVKTNIELNFKSQFHLKETAIVTPDKIKITGPAAVLDTIFQLQTESKIFDELDASFKTTLKIIHPKNVTVNTETVKLEIPIEKFTEKELRVPVQIKNKPENIKIKLFPSEIKLTVLVGLSKFEKIDTSKFDVFVDYKMIKQDTKNLQVIINSIAENIKIIRYSPANVEYLIETK